MRQPFQPEPATAGAAALHPLLGNLATVERAAVVRRLRLVRLETGAVLAAAGAAPGHLHFLIDAAVALRTQNAQACALELAVVGRGRVTAALATITAAPSAHALVVVHPGAALAMRRPSPTFLARIAPGLQARLREAAAREVRAITTAVLRQAGASARERVAAHLAEMWMATEARLLSGHHDAIARQLGLRRATVTVALQELEQAHAVRARRGLVEIVDPVTLEREAGPYLAA
ncbi:helix-turn-helix domain-containing protein [Novosphingobium huizhouense]|uniref:helix-turn-helix domain-containing protein n=1 Tax=Novosphingobium huizhouense TaxID=2866625 RepID=UPI001CD8E984|nr:helix-turn-helix domain-containing protein [Novosphingobium huizhouense]